jgi:exodeoxyribonuclease VII small subunit
MPRSPSSKPADEPSSYEQALGELDRLVLQMEDGQMPLDQVLDAYRRASVLLAFCRQRLQAVEEQVKLLDDGVLKPFPAP